MHTFFLKYLCGWLSMKVKWLYNMETKIVKWDTKFVQNNVFVFFFYMHFWNQKLRVKQEICIVFMLVKKRTVQSPSSIL